MANLCFSWRNYMKIQEKTTSSVNHTPQKLTANAPENRPKRPKRKGLSLSPNHHFPDAMLVSGRLLYHEHSRSQV